jgi:hypothetical protein
MIPSRWFRREGPFVGAHYALENGSDQLRRRASFVAIASISISVVGGDLLFFR